MLKLEKYEAADKALYEELVYNREVMEMNMGRVFRNIGTRVMEREYVNEDGEPAVNYVLK